MLTDLDRHGLWHYRSDYTEPADFDEFWQSTLDETRAHDLAVTVVPVQTDLVTVEVFDLTFAGFGGHPIRAWLRLPAHRTGRLPAVLQFHGYGSSRGAPVDDLLWASAGYAHVLMNVRHQGGRQVGFLTRGLDDPRDYFYRKVFADAVRAVDAVRTLEPVDPARVGIVGASQGGGIALAVAGLVDGLGAIHVQAPFLCDIRRAVDVTGTEPYSELTDHLAARRTADAFTTLSYVDGIAFARRATAPAWFSTGLADDICPPSTAFAAYHEYAGPKQIQVWDHNGHEAGGAEDLVIALAEFRTLLTPHGNEERQ